MNFKLLAFRTSLVLNLIMDYWGRSGSDSASTGLSKNEEAAPVKEEKLQEELANVNVGSIFDIGDYRKTLCPVPPLCLVPPSWNWKNLGRRQNLM